MRVSSKTGFGIKELWDKMCKYREMVGKSGELRTKRSRQMRVWMWNHIRERIMEVFWQQPDVMEKLPKLENLVMKGLITPGLAADILLDCFKQKPAP